MKTIFTTGQVAKICKVAPRTVSKWFDSGRLRGYRIPGSQDRRIPREHLIRFLKEHGMPLTDDLQNDATAVMCVSADKEKFKGVFGDEFNVSCAENAFSAAMTFQSCHANCVILDFSTLREEALPLIRSLLALSDFAPKIIIGVGDPQANHEGCHAFLRDPFDPAMLVADAKRLLGIGGVGGG